MLLRFFIALWMLFGPAVAWALSQEESEHARSAFMFAGRAHWTDARLHAQRSGDDALVTLIDWQYLLDANSGASFNEITRFIAANPDWPEMKKLRIRAEMALQDGGVADHDIIAWFGDSEPITGVGRIALAEALKRTSGASQARIEYFIREAWRQGDFEEIQEKTILTTHASLLETQDHIARADRLLWEEKTAAAARMLPLIPKAHGKLAHARITLIADKKTAALAVAQVPGELLSDPGLIYDRMRYRARRGDDAGVRELLLKASEHVPYPEKWWRQRELQVREAIDEGHYTLAQKLLASHGQREGSNYADAQWLSGWLELEFLKHPNNAYDIFYKLYSNVRYPVSRARAAYWSGRAAEASGDGDAATNWYITAASYPTTFYGQLASLKSYGTAPLRIPAQPGLSPGAGARFEASGLARSVTLSVEMGEIDLAGKLINFMVESSRDTEEAQYAAELGHKVGKPHLSVRGAKKALQQNVVLVETGYPRPATPDVAIERPLALAIARQESEFDSRAKSPAGAMGLMQLMPRTAREVARKSGMGYVLSRLWDSEYNIQLGGLYLSRLIDAYGGSYVMAIAAYNAGPGNVRDWSRQFGTPGNDIESAVMWIEKIPFSETRNYVQRVMENLQVYRYLEAGEGSAKLMMGEDLIK